MQLIILTINLLAATCGGAVVMDLVQRNETGNAAEDPEVPVQYIVGGRYPTFSTSLFLVSLQAKTTGHFCSGSIISPTWVLTAAHCSYLNMRMRPKKSCVAVIGTTKCPRHYHAMSIESQEVDEQYEGNQVINVTEFIIHPKFDMNSSESDIACVNLAHAIDLTGKAEAEKYVGIAQFEMPAGKEIGEKLMIVGWGLGEDHIDLRRINTTAINQDECSMMMKHAHIFESQVCTITPYKIDSCFGDGGSPVFFVEGDAHTVYAVVSHGVGCGLQALPSVNTLVEPHLEFIQCCLAFAELPCQEMKGHTFQGNFLLVVLSIIVFLCLT